ncbi:MAG TPA: IS1 family transposase [candidate division Zixibacteria bacterium]|nr:IS1 family transposase [candidate division Zixibacteria bacterium]
MEKYPAMRTLSWLLKIWAIISSSPFIIFGIDYLLKGEDIKQIGWILIAIGFINFIIIYAFAEILTLLIQIEKNTTDKKVILTEDINCPYCDTELELELKEIFSQRFVCPDCKRIISFNEYYEKQLEHNMFSH